MNCKIKDERRIRIDFQCTYVKLVIIKSRGKKRFQFLFFISVSFKHHRQSIDHSGTAADQKWENLLRFSQFR